MAMQGYGSAPGRNSINAVGSSPPRSVATRKVPIILSHMKPADAKALALKTKK
jgi:hypothetical protein